MGQTERFDFDNNDNYSFKETEGKHPVAIGMENNGIFFGNSGSMGSYSSTISDRPQQQQHHIPSFFSHLGNYYVYNILPNHKKMATILIKLSFVLTNLFGVSIVIYWLTIDFSTLKMIATGIGAVCYMGMKLWEEWLVLKEKIKKHKSTRRKK